MKRIVIPFTIVAVAVGAAAFLIMNSPQPAVQAPEERTLQVATMRVSPEDITFRISSQGTVEPRTQTTLVAEVSGKVVSVADKFVVGGFFQRGEVLISLDDADYAVNVQQAQANLLTAEAQLVQETAQAEQLVRQWQQSGRALADAPPLALRTPFLAEAKSRVLFAEADLARAERQLERTRIRAPYDGLVREKYVDIGQFVGTGAQIALTFAVDFAEIRLPLTDGDLAYLELPRPGQSFSQAGTIREGGNVIAGNGPAVTLEATVAGRRHKWQGKIVRSEGVIDSSTRVTYAVAQIPDPYGLYKTDFSTPLAIGSFVNATLEGTTSRGVVRLPHTAVRDSNVVMLMDGEQRLRQRNVEILRTDSEFTYIGSGLLPGDQVIVSPVPIPIEGMRVVPASSVLSAVGVAQ